MPKKARSRATRRREAERLAATTPHQLRKTYTSLIFSKRKKQKGQVHEVPGGLPGSKR